MIMTQRFRNRLVFAVLLLTCGGFNWFCSNREKTTAVAVYAGLSPDAKYVGMQTCMGCHTGIHSTFIHTGMGSSFDIASKQKSAADFKTHPLVYDKYRDFWYHSYWDNDTLKFSEFRLQGKDTLYKQIKKIDFIIGSGQHTNSHMWRENGYVFQAPMTFYTQQHKWDLPPGFENGNNTRFSRIIGQECMTCHNGYPEFTAGSENKYSLVKNGIDCERCHGPGSFHVKEKQSGNLVDTSRYIDYSIVNPSKLPLDLQLDVCQRCHIQGNAVVETGKSFFDFRPGMKLSDVMDVYMPVYNGSEEEHIMASHAERMRMSKCFTASLAKLEKNKNRNTLRPFKDAMTCVTCHNPHVSVKVSGEQSFNTTCNSCHTPSKDPLCSLPMAERLKKQDNCVSCHMPLNNTTDIPHVSVHDHRIAIHLQKNKSDAIRRFAGINCINNPDPGKRSVAEAFINYAEKFGLGKELLDSALKYLSPVSAPGDDADLLVNVYYLKGDWNKVTELSQYLEKHPSDFSVYDTRPAWTAYRIGEAFTQVSDYPQALKWYNRAVAVTPYYPEFQNKLASALVNTNQSEAALKKYAEIIREHPYYAPAYNNYGYLLLTLRNDVSGAMRNYNIALQLDPDYSNAIVNKAGLFVYQGNSVKAIEILRNHLPHAASKEEIQLLIKRLAKSS